MKSFPLASNLGVVFASLLAAVLATGCAGEKPAPHVAPQAGSSAKRPASDNTATAQVHRSVFTIDGSSRDPFFPQARKQPELGTAAVAVASAPPDIAALLSAGFQGIGGTAERRIALINNILLEPGRQTEIPVKVNNQERRLSVKCREIAKNTIALDVEGYGRVVVKAKSAL